MAYQSVLCETCVNRDNTDCYCAPNSTCPKYEELLVDTNAECCKDALSRSEGSFLHPIIINIVTFCNKAAKEELYIRKVGTTVELTDKTAEGYRLAPILASLADSLSYYSEVAEMLKESLTPIDSATTLKNLFDSLKDKISKAASEKRYDVLNASAGIIWYLHCHVADEGDFDLYDIVWFFEDLKIISQY